MQYVRQLLSDIRGSSIEVGGRAGVCTDASASTNSRVYGAPAGSFLEDIDPDRYPAAAAVPVSPAHVDEVHTECLSRTCRHRLCRADQVLPSARSFR